MAKTCQSCGMPLSKDPAHGGSEADGTKSAKFCSFCYQNGTFTAPDITVQEMQALCIKMMHQNMKMPRPVAWLLTRSIPRLERWRS